MKTDVLSPRQNCARTINHPILFSGPMVLRLLAREKTVTRRLSKSWLKVKAGDRLWVREAYCFSDAFDLLKPSQVPSDESVLWIADRDCRGIVGFGWGKTRPGIFLPRWASRITLEATEDARVERLQDITEEEAEAEGVAQSRCGRAGYAMEPLYSHRTGFVKIWSTLHTKPGERFTDNPDVVRVAFKDVTA